MPLLLLGNVERYFLIIAIFTSTRLYYRKINDIWGIPYHERNAYVDQKICKDWNEETAEIRVNESQWLFELLKDQ